MYLHCNHVARSFHHCCSGKEISITYSESVFAALGIQHATNCHLWPARLYYIFSNFLINGTIFEKKKTLNTKCVFWFSLQPLSQTFLVLRRTARDMIKSIHWSSCKLPIVFVRFSWKLNFLDRISKNSQVPNFMKIRSMWSRGCSIWTEGQMERHMT
jgi:hypothetical protein